MRKLSVIMLLALLFFSCEKSRIKTFPGKWKWVNTSGGFAGGIVAKASVDSVITLNLNDDSSYEVYINKNLKAEGKYSLNNGQNNDTIIVFSPDVSVGKLLIYGRKQYSEFNNKLFLYDYQISDGYSIMFE